MNSNTFKQLIVNNGWASHGRCNTCGGKAVYKFKPTDPARSNELLKVDAKHGSFKYYVNGLLLSRGSLTSLQHQHFIQ